ncbi:MAG: hypothetical protein U0271_21870 [Polyangiaceae bacterium]
MNPFERYDLDPRASVELLTARFRELAEDANEADLPVLRDAWEELTVHPETRVALALETFVEPTGTDHEPVPPPIARPSRDLDAPDAITRQFAFSLVSAADLPPRPSVDSSAPSLTLDPILKELAR